MVEGDGMGKKEEGLKEVEEKVASFNSSALSYLNKIGYFWTSPILISLSSVPLMLIH